MNHALARAMNIVHDVPFSISGRKATRCGLVFLWSIRDSTDYVDTIGLARAAPGHDDDVVTCFMCMHLEHMGFQMLACLRGIR